MAQNTTPPKLLSVMIELNSELYLCSRCTCYRVVTMKYTVPQRERCRTIQTEVFPAGETGSSKATAGVTARLCNWLLDVIVSDKDGSQRSFQSFTLLQKITRGNNHRCWSVTLYVWSTAGICYELSRLSGVSNRSSLTQHYMRGCSAGGVCHRLPVTHSSSQPIQHIPVAV